MVYHSRPELIPYAVQDWVNGFCARCQLCLLLGPNAFGQAGGSCRVGGHYTIRSAVCGIQFMVILPGNRSV